MSLEAAQFRLERDAAVADSARAEAAKHLAGRVEHLTNAVSTLSEDARAFRHETNERFDAVDTRLGSLERGQGEHSAMLQALLTHFKIEPPTAS